MYFLMNLSHYIKSYGHLCQLLAFFTMPVLQTWPCHVTQEANFEKILFFPNSAFNIRKSYKISSRKALYFRSYQPKSSRGGWETSPPVLSGLTKFKHPMLPTKRISHYGFGVLIPSVSSSISSILFYQNQPNL